MMLITSDQRPRSEGETADLVLRANGLRLGYGRRTVLAGVDFAVRRGESWFVIGPNGQGKSTLLKAVMGRLAPQAGRLTREGEFTRPDRLGFVPQTSSFNPTLPTTVQEFVLLGMVGLKATAAEEQVRFAAALEQVGLVGLELRNYWSLSEGQRQRALVARALVRRPNLLVADEPTSGLDMYVEATLLETLTRMNRTEQLTLVLVVHDLALAARHATHVALVHNGRVDAGPAADILRPDLLTQAYQVPVEIQREPDGAVNVRLGLAGRVR